MAVLVTRPGERGIKLVEMLNKAGIAALHFPLFDIVAGRELNLLPHRLSQLKSNDYVVTVSRNAVHYAHQTLTSAGFNWRSDLSYFAVGQGTAECLASTIDMPVCYPFSQQNSEGLLALSAMSKENLANKQVLLLRGNEGRSLFPEQIIARQGQLDIIECYQRQPVRYTDDIIQQVNIWKRAGIDSILATSAEIVNYLVNIVPSEEYLWLKNCTLITVSQRIAQVAQQQGWRDILLSPRADNMTLFSTIVSRFAS